MKTLYLILLLFITVSCATKPIVSQSINEEYEIVRLAIKRYKIIKSTEFRFIEKPDNNIITDYYNGFYQHPFYNGSLQLPGLTFSLKDNHAVKWDKKIIGDTIATKKLIIIEDAKKIKKLTKNEDIEKSDIFFIFSNPIFSNNEEYALINVYSFFNHIISPSESSILIFKKINGNWTYIDEFAAYIS